MSFISLISGVSLLWLPAKGWQLFEFLPKKKLKKISFQSIIFFLFRALLLLAHHYMLTAQTLASFSFILSLFKPSISQRCSGAHSLVLFGSPQLILTGCSTTNTPALSEPAVDIRTL